MKKISLLFVIISLLALARCTNEGEIRRTKKVELEILLFNRINNADTNNFKYPQEISKICEVIQNTCNDTNFAFNPLIFSRTDLNKKHIIDLLEGKPGNPTINYIKLQNDHFFRDSLINEILKKPVNSNYAFIDFFSTIIDKKRYFVYSSDEDLKIDSMIVYHSTDELRKAISSAICVNNFSKIVIVYEPKNEQVPHEDDSVIVIEPEKEDPGKNEDNSEKTRTEVKNLLLEISNASLSSDARRKKVKESMASVFDKNFYVLMYLEKSSELSNVWPEGKGVDYLEKLTIDNSIIGFEVLRVFRNTTDNKIYHIRVVEKHKEN